MGYRRKNYRLRWPEGHELAGLEVVLKGMRIGALGQVASARGADPQNLDPRIITDLSDMFAEHLVEWNYEDEFGVPLPATAQSVADMDIRVLMQIVMKWAEVAADVPTPLSRPSSNGAPFPVASIPMEIP